MLALIDSFAQSDIQNVLRRQGIKAAPAGIAADAHHSKAIHRIGTDALVGVQIAVFDLRFKGL